MSSSSQISAIFIHLSFVQKAKEHARNELRVINSGQTPEVYHMLIIGNLIFGKHPTSNFFIFMVRAFEFQFEQFRNLSPVTCKKVCLIKVGWLAGCDHKTTLYTLSVFMCRRD